jgi:hypothetical protein
MYHNFTQQLALQQRNLPLIASDGRTLKIFPTRQYKFVSATCLLSKYREF